MKQASLKLTLNVKKTRKQLFLEQMEQVVPWAALAALVELITPGVLKNQVQHLCCKVPPWRKFTNT